MMNDLRPSDSKFSFYLLIIIIVSLFCEAHFILIMAY